MHGITKNDSTFLGSGQRNDLRSNGEQPELTGAAPVNSARIPGGELDETAYTG
jgi:hypothetical protein